MGVDEALDSEVDRVFEAEVVSPIDDFPEFEHANASHDAMYCSSCSAKIEPFTSKAGKLWTPNEWAAWVGKKYGETLCKNCAMQRGTQ